MFSTSQMDMLEPMVQAYFEQGYNYYIVHTNTNLSNNSYNNYDFYDLTFYFSHSPIRINNNVFSFSSDEVIKVNAITRNVSNFDTDSKLNRIQTSSYTNSSVTIPLYEHISTNGTGDIYMNILADEQFTIDNNLSYQLDYNDFLVLPVILSILVLVTWLRSWFGKNYKGK